MQKARNKTISDVLVADREQVAQEKQSVQQQLNNFAVLVTNINRSKAEKDVVTPSLDQVYDLFQIGSINTAQYNAILINTVQCNSVKLSTAP